MKENWNFAITELLKSEGGYTNDPNDSGGATNFGITIADYRRYINRNGTALDVKNMTVTQAKAIYKSKYWDALNGDKLESGVDYTCFDYGVLAGLGRPRACLQKFSNLSGDKLIDAINDERTGFLTRLATNRPKDKKFLRGWLNRTQRVRTQSHALRKDNTTGPIIGGGAVIIGSTAASYTNYFTTHPYITAAVIISAAAIIAYGIHWYKNRKVKENVELVHGNEMASVVGPERLEAQLDEARGLDGNSPVTGTSRPEHP